MDCSIGPASGTQKLYLVRGRGRQRRSKVHDVHEAWNPQARNFREGLIPHRQSTEVDQDAHRSRWPDNRTAEPPCLKFDAVCLNSPARTCCRCLRRRHQEVPDSHTTEELLLSSVLLDDDANNTKTNKNQGHQNSTNYFKLGHSSPSCIAMTSPCCAVMLHLIIP